MNSNTINVYEDIKNKLMEKGVLAEEIAFIHQANTELRKAELFSKVRSGQVRFLLGSTAKMGAGTNVQDRLIALHHLDVPWRPSDIEQQKGRILRQGNRNPKVKIFRYVTEGTFDSYSWQLIENKQKFISQIMTSKSPVRSCEDVDEAALSYAEVKALAMGNLYIKEKMDLDIQVSKLKLMKANHISQKYRLEDNIAKHYPQQITILKERISGLQADIQTAKANLPADKECFSIKVGNKVYTDKKEAGTALVEMCKEIKSVNTSEVIGEYAGFKMAVSLDSFNHKFVMNIKGQLSHNLEIGVDPLGNISRINHALKAMTKELAEASTKLENVERQLETAKLEVTKPFAQEAELSEKLDRLSALNALLNMDEKGDDGIGMEDDKSELGTEQVADARKPYPIENSLQRDKEIDVLPDPMIGLSEMREYGYQWNEMLPLIKKKALELSERELPVYLLHTDGTEVMAENKNHIEKHDGIFGIEKKDWEQEESDLDVVVELSTNEREDDLFNTFNEDGLHIGTVKVDINPITSQHTGTLKTYLPQVEDYLVSIRAAREQETAQKIQQTSGHNVQRTEKEIEVTLTVAECSEFHNLGKFYENIPTVEEAIAIWKQIPLECMNGIPAIGIHIHRSGEEKYMDDEIDLFSGKRIDLDILDYIPSIKNEPKAMEVVTELVAKLPDMEINGVMSEEMEARVWEMRMPDLTPAEQLAVTFDRLSYDYDAILYHDSIRTMTENVSELTGRIKQGDSKHLTDWLKEIILEGAVPEETERAKELLEKLTEYRPLAKIEKLEEQNYNMVDNVLNNGMEKVQEKATGNVQNQFATRTSLKERLAEKKAQIVYYEL